MSDFGVRDDAVAICKGVMLRIAPDLRIVDLTHDVTAFDIREGAFYLAQTAPYYPAGTVFVGVVDPGVGTERRAIVLQTERGQLFVAPDNGLLSLVAMDQGVAGIWEVTNPEFMLPSPSATFHGRDLFTPCAAWLAKGRAPQEVGPEIEQMVSLDIEPARLDADRMAGEVMLLDKAYGNVWTNISRSLVDEFIASSGSKVSIASSSDPVRLEARFYRADTKDSEKATPVILPLVRTFGDVREGSDLAYFNSRDLLSFAVNMGSFAEAHGVAAGDEVEIRIARP